MKKKIVSLLLAMLLLGTSSAAYAAQSANLSGAYGALNGLNLVSCLPDCGDFVSVNNVACASDQLSNLLKKATGYVLENPCPSLEAVKSQSSTPKAPAATAAPNATKAPSVTAAPKATCAPNAPAAPQSTIFNFSNEYARNLQDVLKQILQSACPTLPVKTPACTPVQTPAPTAKPTQAPVETEKPVETQKPAETPAPTLAPTPAPTAEPSPTLPSGADNLSYEKKVVELVNVERAANGLEPLTLSDKLSKVARLKSQDMHDNKYFAHESPTYGSPFEMMKTFGISYRSAGENIAKGYRTPEAVVEGWMNSPGHRANILNKSFTTIGVGYVADGHYWTQEFIG